MLSNNDSENVEVCIYRNTLCIMYVYIDVYVYMHTECVYIRVNMLYVLYCVYLDTGTQLPKLPPGDHTSIPQFTRQGSSKQTKGITDAVRSPIKWF